MKKLVIAILLLVSPAVAQTSVNWSNGACYIDGIYFPARSFGECFSADAIAFAQVAPPANLLGATVGTVAASGLSVNAITASCPIDRTLVMTAPGAFKCAKDLTNPE